MPIGGLSRAAPQFVRENQSQETGVEVSPLAGLIRAELRDDKDGPWGQLAIKAGLLAAQKTRGLGLPVPSLDPADQAAERRQVHAIVAEAETAARSVPNAWIREVGTRDRPAELEPTNGEAWKIDRVAFDDGKARYFRPVVGDTRAWRKSWVAADLNRRMGLTTVARASFAQVWTGDGLVLGVLSEEARGKALDRDDPIYLGSASDEASLATRDFEFLVGNADAHNFDIRRNPGDGVLTTYDHDKAFTTTLPNRRRPFVASIPPRAQAKAFRRGLSVVSAGDIIRRYERFLTCAELGGLVFRYLWQREIAAMAGIEGV